jgi:DNA polymerase-3 subunit delta'
MQTNTLFPWLDSTWATVLTQIKKQRLPHALLLSGMKGLGKLEFAKHLAQLLLCENGERNLAYCQNCNACHQFSASTHLDFKLLQPEENTAVIKIDQVREIIDFFNHTALQSAYKIVIFYPAEALNSAAANALLKTLEEPPLNKNLLLLVSHQPALLLPTLRSRCQQIKLNPPTRDIAKHWLSQYTDDKESLELALTLVEGAPLLALTFIKENKHTAAINLLTDLTALMLKNNDPVTIAEKWLKIDISEFLTLLMLLITQMIRYQLGANSPLFTEHELQKKMMFIAHTFNLIQLFAYLDFIIEQRRSLEHKINLNSQMLLESLFCRFNPI